MLMTQIWFIDTNGQTLDMTPSPIEFLPQKGEQLWLRSPEKTLEEWVVGSVSHVIDTHSRIHTITIMCERAMEEKEGTENAPVWFRNFQRHVLSKTVPRG